MNDKTPAPHEDGRRPDAPMTPQMAALIRELGMDPAKVEERAREIHAENLKAKNWRA